MELRIYHSRPVDVPRFNIQIIKRKGIPEGPRGIIIAPVHFPPKSITPLIGTNILYSPEGFTPEKRTLPREIHDALLAKWLEIAPLIEPNSRYGHFLASIDVRII